MTITDIISLVCFVFLAWRGFSRGFLGSLVGPLSLVIATIVSFIYYIFTKNVPISLAIGLLGPLFLGWLFRFILRSWNQLNNPDNKLSLISRIGGSIISAAWGMTMVILMVLLLVMVPPFNDPIKVMDVDIHSSVLYRLIKPFDITAEDKKAASNAPQLTPQQNMEILADDPRIQSIVNDPQILDAVNRKDYASLMSNPKIADLMKDPAMLKKMLTIYKDLPPDQQKLSQ